jgi:segregation and condensation protein A
MTQRVPINVRLEAFEGPLDLLLYFIQNHALDISQVSIDKITSQYLTYIKIMQELNFDIASEFLVMASTLLHWKSKALLPSISTQEEASPEIVLTPEELIRQLLEHQRFLKQAEILSQLPHLGSDTFTRSNRKPPIERIWREMNLSDLTLSYQEILIRARKRTQVLQKETVSVGDKILELSTKLPLQELIEFASLIPMHSRSEIVASFLAILELGRLKKMKIFQEEAYGSIYVQLIALIESFEKNLSDFDLVLQEPTSS